MFGDVMAQAEAFPQWLQWWLRWMQIMLILLPIFFIRYREAQILLLAQVMNFAVGAGVVLWEGGQVTKLFGLGHVFGPSPLSLFCGAGAVALSTFRGGPSIAHGSTGR